MGSIRLAWWNLQNLFDTVDDPISADLEFTVAEGWTPEVYAAKLANLAVAINELHDGEGPELLGVCEVEGDAVFQELLDAVGRPHLKIVSDPTRTSDLRGIDTSVAYDDRKLRPVEQHSHVVHLRYATRDIFEVVFEVLETGTYFIDATRDEAFANRYQVLDQIIASRGLLDDGGLHLDVDSVEIHNTKTVATQPARRPRGFDRKSKRGTSDHLPVTAVLAY